MTMAVVVPPGTCWPDRAVPSNGVNSGTSQPGEINRVGPHSESSFCNSSFYSLESVLRSHQFPGQPTASPARMMDLDHLIALIVSVDC
jgi:hypothetical protein